MKIIDIIITLLTFAGFCWAFTLVEHPALRGMIWSIAMITLSIEVYGLYGSYQNKKKKRNQKMHYLNKRDKAL
jgi:hypothetical protein